MYVLNSVQGVKEGIVWEASEICLMKCQNASSKALLKGFVEQVNVEIRD
ncbi:MAG: hypothetical protein HC848_02065 [Limnobacter sp.]|nr:hypothetical protein [Limnobacter sp.]